MFRGFAHAVRANTRVDVRQAAAAMQAGVQAARQALLSPVEGTILSVAGAAAGAAAAAAERESSFAALLQKAVDAANEALQRTPGQLGVLAEAGVVDAGGQGFLYMIEGALRMLFGSRPYQTAFAPPSPGNVSLRTRYKVEHNKYCTEFVLLDPSRDADGVRAVLCGLGDSLIVAGAGDTLRVHIHTDVPDEVCAAARELATLTRLKVDDMATQHAAALAKRELKPRGIAAVVPGDGFARICKELGADVTLGAGGGNPSVQELLAAVDDVSAQCVYLLPNDNNVVPAAQEVLALTQRRVVVVPTASIAEGIAALLYLANEPHETTEQGAQLRAKSTRNLIASGSIFNAGKDAALGGVAVKGGQLSGAIDARDGRPARLISGADAAGIAAAFVRAAQAGGGGASLLTLYYGGRRTQRDAEELASSVSASFPELTVEAYYGGQSACDYVMSLER